MVVVIIISVRNWSNSEQKAHSSLLYEDGFSVVVYLINHTALNCQCPVYQEDSGITPVLFHPLHVSTYTQADHVSSFYTHTYSVKLIFKHVTL